jgi:predicted 3-demethylubiquinone-9 3-methyltransferase (glyoxalase superfamily)
MFDGVAEEAMNFYVSLFKGSEVSNVERYGPGEQGIGGSVKIADFILGGQHFRCIDSPIKHAFSFTPSMLDEAFKELSAGGEVLMPVGDYGFSAKFGWVNDRFGVSWQLNLE